MRTQKEIESRGIIAPRESAAKPKPADPADRATPLQPGSYAARTLPARFLEGTAWDEV
jgi:hypothetical protein